jgi:gliding motility-associated-like protein
VSAVIYDRWGHQVYELNNSATGNISWDGKNQLGKEVAEGTYYYIIKAQGKDGVPYEKKGTISLYK